MVQWYSSPVGLHLASPRSQFTRCYVPAPVFRTRHTTMLWTERVHTVSESGGLRDVSIRGIILVFSLRTALIPITGHRIYLRTKEKT